MERAHEVMEEEGLRIAFLGTGKQLFAHALYLKMGYRDFHNLPTGLRRIRPSQDKHISLRDYGFEDMKAVHEHYRDYCSQCTGFTHRQRNFIEVRRAWTWMAIETPQIFTSDNEVVGYAMFHTKPRTLSILEIVIENEFLGEAISLLEDKHRNDITHTEIKDCVHEDRRGLLSKLGFNVVEPSWETMMVASLDPNLTIEDIQALYGIKTDCFHMTEVDAF